MSFWEAAPIRLTLLAAAALVAGLGAARAQYLSPLGGSWILAAPVSLNSLWGGAQGAPEPDNCVTVVMGRDGPRQHCNPLAKPASAQNSEAAHAPVAESATLR